MPLIASPRDPEGHMSPWHKHGKVGFMASRNRWASIPPDLESAWLDMADRGRLAIPTWIQLGYLITSNIHLATSISAFLYICLKVGTYIQTLGKLRRSNGLRAEFIRMVGVEATTCSNHISSYKTGEPRGVWEGVCPRLQFPQLPLLGTPSTPFLSMWPDTSARPRC
ncbi:hypothetical protein V2G26_000937 [Clonostachys chloroleuca]